MGHGGGGRMTMQLIDTLFLTAFDNDILRQMNDQACFSVPAGRMVMSTDSHVVSPLFFPGGDIGSLSVNGTINDVAMSGARPHYLSASFILEEGFPCPISSASSNRWQKQHTVQGCLSLLVIPKLWKREKVMVYSSRPRGR